MTSEELLALTVAALLGPGASAGIPVYATGCGAAIFSPNDWPTQDSQYPRTKVRLLNEQKIGLGRNGPPAFTVTSTIRIVIEVSQPAQVDDLGAVAAQQQLWALARQHEVALIGSYPIESSIQQFVSVLTQLTYTSEQATHLAGAQIDVAMEFFQGAEMFAPIEADDLTSCGMDVTNYPGLAGFFPLT